MKFQVIGVTYHNFKETKRQGNVVYAKCTCCQRPRLAVYTLTETKKIFFYSGYDEQIAQMHFTSLIKHQNSQSQD
jgi:hypothetical protein